MHINPSSRCPLRITYCWEMGITTGEGPAYERATLLLTFWVKDV